MSEKKSKHKKTKSTKDGKPAILSNLMDVENDAPRYVIQFFKITKF